MANVYQVNIEGTVTEATTVAEVKSLLGDSKVTKKAIEAGEYPMITIADEPTLELDTTDEVDDSVDMADVAVDNAVEEVEVDITDEVAITNTDDDDTTDDDVDTTEVDTTDEVDTDDTDDDVSDLDLSLYVNGATAILSDDSDNEEFIEWLFDNDVEEVTISAVDNKGNVEIKGYDGALHAVDLTVTAPPKAKKSSAKASVNPEVDGYPEVGYFTEEGDMKKYIKKLSYEQLEEWCANEGVEYNEHDNQSITRMRMAMAIKSKHFTHLASGNGKSKSKKKSKYGDYSNEDLAKLCMDNDVDVADAKGDARIERMYMVMALRKAGIIE